MLSDRCCTLTFRTIVANFKKQILVKQKGEKKMVQIPMVEDGLNGRDFRFATKA